MREFWVNILVWLIIFGFFLALLFTAYDVFRHFNAWVRRTFYIEQPEENRMVELYEQELRDPTAPQPYDRERDTLRDMWDRR